MSPDVEKPAAVPLGRGIATFASLTGGRLVGDLFNFLFFVVVANSFGELGAGQYSIALGLGGFFFIFVDAGLYYQAIQKGEAADAELGIALVVRFALAFLLMVLLGAAFGLTDVSYEIAVLIALIAVAQVGYALRMGLSVIFVRRGHAHLAGLIEAVAKLAGALLGIIVILAGGSLLWAVASQPVTSVLAAAVSWRMVHRRYGRPTLTPVRTRFWPLLRATMPFGLGELPRLIAARTDVLALGLLLGPAAAGAYNAAFRIIFLLQLATHFAGVSILAEGARSAARSESSVRELYAASLRLCVLLGVPSAAGVWLVAPQLIELVYGAGFADSVGVLRLLAIVLLLSIFRTIIGSFVTLSGLQGRRAWMEWVAAVTVAVGCFVLIPLLGLHGAAYAAGMTEALLLLLFARQMWLRGARPHLGVRIAAALMGTAAFLVLASVLPPLPMALEILVSVVVYTAVIAAIPAIRREEVAVLVKATRALPPLRASRP